jgi:TorA maturation chaperone TorD
MNGFNKEELLILSKLAEQRSKVYMFLSTFYNLRPRTDFVKRLKEIAMQGLLRSSIAEDSELMKEGFTTLEVFINSISDISEDRVAEELAIDFTRLMRGIKEGYGPPPPYESVWRGEGRVMGRWTEKVLKTYHDSGIGMDLEDELPDYIGIELKFMSLLCYKEAEALRDGDLEKRRRFLDIEKAFFNDHIIAWIPAFTEVMSKEARTAFYKAVAKITEGFLRLDEEVIRSL